MLIHYIRTPSNVVGFAEVAFLRNKVNHHFRGYRLGEGLD